MITTQISTPISSIQDIFYPLTGERLFERGDETEPENLVASRALQAIHSLYPDNKRLSRLINQSREDFQDGVTPLLDIGAVLGEFMLLFEVDIIEKGNMEILCRLTQPKASELI